MDKRTKQTFDLAHQILVFAVNTRPVKDLDPFIVSLALSMAAGRAIGGLIGHGITTDEQSNELFPSALNVIIESANNCLKELGSEYRIESISLGPDTDKGVH